MNLYQLYNKLITKPGYTKSGIPKLMQMTNNEYDREEIHKVLIAAKNKLNFLNEESTESFVDKYDSTSNVSPLFETLKRLKLIDKIESIYDIDNIKNILKNAVVKKSHRIKGLSPYSNGNPENVLIIGDLHEPFCLEGYIKHCRQKQEEFDCGTVVFIGDIIDNHYASYHENELDAYGPNEEFKRAKDKIADWYEIFPKAYVCVGNHDRMVHRKAKTAGIAKEWIRSYADALETPNWNYVANVELYDVNYNHGEGGTAKTRMKKELQSQVQGHLHTQAYIEYIVGSKFKVFGFQVGCGIDKESFAMAYAKNGPKPIISCGVVLNKGQLPIILPMDL